MYGLSAGTLNYVDGNGQLVIGTGVQAFGLAYGGVGLYVHYTNGVLNYTDGHGWQVEATNDQSFALAWGGIREYILYYDGTLNFSDSQGWVNADSNVQSFVLGPGGYTLDVLEWNGNLWQYANPGRFMPANRTLLEGGVWVIWLSSDGFTLFTLDSNGVHQFMA